MHESYTDIRARIAEDPQWFDEHAVPRYVPFSPDRIADIYARETALVLIACQSCGREFRVAFSYGVKDKMKEAQRLFLGELLDLADDDCPQLADLKARYKGAFERTWEHTLSDDIRAKAIHYGDPPNTDCCPGGPTMNSEPQRVLEYWRKEEDRSSPSWMEWVRDSSLEIDLTCDTAAKIESGA